MKKLLLISFFLIFIIPISVYAQIDSIIVQTTTKGKTFSQVIQELNTNLSYNFIYKDEWLKNITINQEYKGQKLVSFLNKELEKVKMSYINYYNLIVILNQEKKSSIQKYKSDESDLVVIGDNSGLKGETATIQGKLLDGAFNEPLLGSQIYVKSLNIGSTSDLEGNYQVRLPIGRFVMEVSYVGYETKVFPVLITSSGNLNVELFTSTFQLEEVFVSAQAVDNNVKGSVSGLERMNIETIKKLPTFLGEIDPVKSMVTLPGVSTQGDVSSGFIVRGGEAGQNLILQDGAIIYNPSHMFGFFSAFNPELINDMLLYKGGGPANYGGRISSVMNLKFKNGDLEKAKFSGGFGIVSSRALIEIPIIKKKSSLMISGRTSYTEWLLNAFPRIDPKKNESKFYDTHVKYYHKVNNSDQFTTSFYLSDDQFRISSDTTNGWQTKNFTFQWDHLFNKSNLLTFQFANSNYTSGTWDDITARQFEYKNSISNWQGSVNFLHNFSQTNKLLLGVDVNYTKNNPGSLKPATSNIVTEPFESNKQYGVESAFFVQHDIDLTTRFSISSGIRFSLFNRLGSEQVYQFQEPARFPVISDSTYFAKNEIIQTYYGFEPRLSMRYLLTAFSSVKFSYYRINQYFHLISNSVSVNPLDYWMASGPQLEPQKGNQFSIGYFKNSEDNQYEFSSELFYKTVQNSIDYIEGAEIEFNKYIESNLIQGLGTAYGAEFMFKKNTGTLNGWIAYTYSRSLRKFDSPNKIQTVNNGKFYPSNNDKPHDLSIVLSYQLSGRMILSTNFSYSTGRPITIPVSKFSYDKKLSILTYSNRNEFRIPDYHRLDLSVTFKDDLKKNKLIHGEWVISIFNVYSRKNVYSIFFNDTGTAYKMSVLGSFFPSISYNFKL
ncbi:MAG: TonB-dependent receptor [Bacteroidetes bacterium]|nr:TonB-dependent receptor [Bacteroidota bacterium]